MKTKIFTLFFALVASVGTMFAWDYEHVQIGDLYYNLDATNHTAEVTSQNSDYPYWSTSITTANIPASVEYNSIPYSVTSIGDNAFFDCSGLTSVEIPNSVTSIGGWAFCGCTSLTSIEIPNSVTSIGESAFYVTGLTSIEIPNSVTSIGDVAFSDCTGLTSVTIPNSVTSIGEGAFFECTGLTSVEIPNSVTSIGDGTFLGCTGLTSINVASDNLNYCSEDGILFNKDKSILIQYPASKNNTEYDIPNSVTSIGAAAFYVCSGLTSITIPNSVTSIGGWAFYGCTSLTSLTCMATTPPALGEDVFLGTVTTSTLLYVPVGSINAYKVAEQWKEFTNILPIAAKDTETTTVKAEPTTNSVEITWPVVAGAYTYEIVIKDKSGNVVCTLVFNAQGQLISIAFNAPSRDGAPQQTQGAGFSFTTTGLTAGTSYDVTITAKDSNGNTLDTRTSSFTTKGEAPQGIDDINAATKSQKIVRNNQVLILRGDKTYTIQGQEVK